MDLAHFEVFKVNEYQVIENNRRQLYLNKNLYMDIVVGDMCNCRCQFCIGRLIHKQEIAPLDPARMAKIRFAHDKLGVQEVLLVGGEPTIHPEIVDYIKFCKEVGFTKICITTNGLEFNKLKWRLTDKLCGHGVTHVNLSIMSWNHEIQKRINRSSSFLSLEDANNFLIDVRGYGAVTRINTNCFKGNNDTVGSIIHFYELCQKTPAHSVKFSPLLVTDSFSTVNEVTYFNKEHTLTPDEYDSLFKGVETKYAKNPIVRNPETFGFVKYTMIVMRESRREPHIILNYNHRGKLREKALEGMFNSVKLLTNGELSLSWNREDSSQFIKT